MRDLVVSLALGGVLLCGATTLHAQQPPPQEPRRIPGLTVDDPFPGACVGCHVLRAEENLDVRLSTIMKGWSSAVPATLVARVRHTAPEGLVLEGKHPEVEAAVFQRIPGACLECHGRASKKAPPFARMLHAIHLQGGAENHFLTMFQGECTLCHKLDTKTGAWVVPSGPER